MIGVALMVLAVAAGYVSVQALVAGLALIALLRRKPATTEGKWPSAEQIASDGDHGTVSYAYQK